MDPIWEHMCKYNYQEADAPGSAADHDQRAEFPLDRDGQIEPHRSPKL